MAATAAAHIEAEVAVEVAVTVAVTRAITIPVITTIATVAAPWTPGLRCSERNRHGAGYGCGTQCFGQFIHICYLK
jgi:hypothetical protein